MTSIFRTASLGSRWMALCLLALVISIIVVQPAQAAPTEWGEVYREALRLQEAGDYEQGFEVAKQALQAAEQQFGPDHLNTATSLNYLGVLYARRKGQREAGVPLLQRAVVIREREYGRTSWDVATTLYNLALLYDWNRQPVEAEPLLMRVLAIREAALGPTAADLEGVLTELGHNSFHQARYAQALQYYQRVVAINERALKSDDPLLASSRNNVELAQEKIREHEARTAAVTAVARAPAPAAPVLEQERTRKEAQAKERRTRLTSSLLDVLSTVATGAVAYQEAKSAGANKGGSPRAAVNTIASDGSARAGMLVPSYVSPPRCPRREPGVEKDPPVNPRGLVPYLPERCTVPHHVFTEQALSYWQLMLQWYPFKSDGRGRRTEGDHGSPSWAKTVADKILSATGHGVEGVDLKTSDSPAQVRNQLQGHARDSDSALCVFEENLEKLNDMSDSQPEDYAINRAGYNMRIAEIDLKACMLLTLPPD